MIMIMILHIWIGFSLHHPAIGYPHLWTPSPSPRPLCCSSAVLGSRSAPSPTPPAASPVASAWHKCVAPVPKMVENPTGKAHSNIWKIHMETRKRCRKDCFQGSSLRCSRGLLEKPTDKFQGTWFSTEKKHMGNTWNIDGNINVLWHSMEHMYVLNLLSEKKTLWTIYFIYLLYGQNDEKRNIEKHIHHSIET